jgi:hypothetical protein
MAPSNDDKIDRTAGSAGAYPAFDPNGVDEVLRRNVLTPPAGTPTANGTEEVLADDILEAVALGYSEVPSIAPFALSITPPPVDVDADVAETRVLPARVHPIAPRIFGAVALAILACLAVLVGLRLWDARGPRSVSSVTVVQATRPPPPPDEKQIIPTVRLDNLPVVSSSLGTLRFAPNAKGHRVYVDGVLLGEPNETFDVKCGPRMVKVGYRGTVQTIEVPCGGEVLVSLR